MISFILVILALLNATPCALIRTKGFIQPIAFSLYRSCVNRIDTNEVSSEMSRKDDDIIDGKTNNASKKKIKVLCLHGYLVSADVFAFQLRHLVDGTSDIADYKFIDAPFEFRFTQDGNRYNTTGSARKKRKYSWIRGVESSVDDTTTYSGLAEAIKYISDVNEKEGPFDVVLGHSQGAGVALCLCAMSCNPHLVDVIASSSVEHELQTDVSVLEILQIKLAVMMSAFLPRDSRLVHAMNEIERRNPRGMRIPSLHIFSDDDKVVTPAASIEVLNYFDSPRMMIRSNAGHEPPSECDDTLSCLREELIKISNAQVTRNTTSS